MDIDAAPVVSMALAWGNLALWGAVGIISVREWVRFHDDRAARGVLLSLVLIAASLGSVVSATGFYVLTKGGDVVVLTTLASLARGAMIAGGVAYLASLRHREDHRDDGDGSSNG